MKNKVSTPMDTMTATKIVGGVCGSFLIFLLVKWGAESIYHGGGHGETEAAYVIEVEEEATEVASDATSDEPTFADLYAAADAAAGEKVFKKCKACHKLEDGVSATGPSLYGVVDRAIGSADYKYSEVMAGFGGNWTPEALDGFLKRPKDYMAGTKMTYSGLKGEKDRANLIAYLATVGG